MPNEHVAPEGTDISLKLISNSPLRADVSKLQPDDTYNPHPPTELQKSAVGTIPPNHVAPNVKPPEAPTINVTLVNV